MRGLTQPFAASYLGISLREIIRYERGMTHPPLETVIAMHRMTGGSVPAWAWYPSLLNLPELRVADGEQWRD